MKKHISIAIALMLFAIPPAYALVVPTSTGKVTNAQQFKVEATKHYDKLYYLSEVKLKQQKTNRDKAIIACVEIPNAVYDVIKFNNINKSLFDDATRTKIDEQNKQLISNNLTMYERLDCNEAIKFYKLKR